MIIANRVIKATDLLHRKMLRNVLRSPISFFEKTPVGRIVQRFVLLQNLNTKVPVPYKSDQNYWISKNGGRQKYSLQTNIFTTKQFFKRIKNSRVNMYYYNIPNLRIHQWIYAVDLR